IRRWPCGTSRLKRPFFHRLALRANWLYTQCQMAGKEGTMPATSVIVEALGGRATLDNPVDCPADLSAHIRAGLPYASLESVMTKFDLRREEVSSALHLPPRTLARRKQEQRLSPDESDRLFRLVRLAS